MTHSHAINCGVSMNEDIVSLENLESWISEEYTVFFMPNLYEFEFLFRITRWADMFSFKICGITINKDFVTFEIGFIHKWERLEGIYVLVRKPLHRLSYEDQKIQEFKDWIIKTFKKSNPRFKLGYDPKDFD